MGVRHNNKRIKKGIKSERRNRTQAKVRGRNMKWGETFSSTHEPTIRLLKNVMRLLMLY
jgi:hypothetical protein